MKAYVIHSTPNSAVREGDARYVETLHGSGGSLAEADRVELIRYAAGAGPLRRYFNRQTGDSYSLGALAVDWLTEHAGGAAAIAQFWRELGTADAWHQAFEAAFGLTPDAFYDRFEAYRASLLASTLPHLADDVAEPIVTTSGNVPAAIVATIRTEAERLQAFYRDRFKAPAADYTIRVVSGTAYQSDAEAFAGSARPCRTSAFRAPGYVTVLDASCDVAQLAYLLAGTHLDYVRDGTRFSFEEMPEWLRVGIDAYLDYHYAQVSSVAISTGGRSPALARRAGRGSYPLRAFASWDGARAGSVAGAHGLPFLAVEWLAEHAGEPSLFAFWREYEADSRSDWRGAFETAFGLTPDAFYDRFEAYRATLR